jgi:hypothetical protein
VTYRSRPPVLRRRIPISLAAVALALFSALPAAAQDADPLTKLDPASRYTIETLVDSATTLGLPADYLRSTALQGVALKVDGRRIVDAVRKKFSLLKTAYATLGPVGGEELKAAASVLYAGAKPAQLIPFKARQKDRNDLDAFVVWADLITRGVPSDEASSAITKLWQDGASDATFNGLWNSVQSDILKGLNPGAALQSRIRETPERSTGTKVSPP